MPRISVIVPLYNVERYVGACIASLRAQTFDDFEVVCVNDGSTDSSLARAREAAAGDGRFVFVERENGGLSAARNTGLDVARGDYVSFLDSDDWYEPWTLEMLDAVASAGELDVVDFSARTVYESERIRRIREEVFDARAPIEGVLSGPDIFARYWENRDYISSACFHLIRRAMLERANLRFLEGVLHEDELFTPLMYAHAERVAFLDESLYCRRMREGSIMTQPRSLANVKSMFEISRLLYAWMAARVDDYDERFIDAFALTIANVRDAAFTGLQQIDFAEAREYIDSLDKRDRFEFDLSARYVSDQAQLRYEDVTTSRVYKAAMMVAVVPRYLRDHLMKRGR